MVTERGCHKRQARRVLAGRRRPERASTDAGRVQCRDREKATGASAHAWYGTWPLWRSLTRSSALRKPGGALRTSSEPHSGSLAVPCGDRPARGAHTDPATHARHTRRDTLSAALSSHAVQPAARTSNKAMSSGGCDQAWVVERIRSKRTSWPGEAPRFESVESAGLPSAASAT